MKLKLLTASIVAATLVGCGGDGEDVFDVPASSSSSSSSAGANTPATFDGLSATVSNSADADLEGRVLVSDEDDGESSIQALTGESTMYGTFSIDEEGFWTYTLDTDAPDVAGLEGEDDTIVDEIEILSADGTEAVLEITITGGEAIDTTRAAKITDDDNFDAGELRYKLGGDEVIEQGKLTVNFLKEDDAVDTEGNAKDAYIGLYGVSTSTSNALVDLRIQSDKFLIRDQDDIEVSIPFTPGQWTPVEITWDASDADDTQTPLVTVTINGESVTTEAFRSAAGDPLSVRAGVQVAIFKFGDDSAIVEDRAYYVDDIKLYSDKEGESLVFEDDFEDRPVGQLLDPDENPDITDYHGNSQWAIVADVPLAGFPGSGPGNDGNKVAQITDTMSDDAGELRYKRGDEEVLEQGRMSVTFLKNANAVDEEGNNKDAYIGLYGNSTSTNDALVDLRIKSDGYQIRNQDDLDVTVPFTPDVWTNVEIAWDASSATDSLPPTLTIWIDGTEVAGGEFESASASLADVMSGVQTFIYKFGDNSAIIPDAGYFVDNIKIYSDMDGTELVHEDDFESYGVGDSLDLDDNPDSLYHGNTAESIVAEEPVVTEAE